MFGAPAAFWDQAVTVKMEASTGWREKKMEDALVHDGCEIAIPFMRERERNQPSSCLNDYIFVLSIWTAEPSLTDTDIKGSNSCERSLKVDKLHFQDKRFKMPILSRVSFKPLKVQMNVRSSFPEGRF